jgi:ABC-type transport system involved in cytochrome c biogenesis permease component
VSYLGPLVIMLIVLSPVLIPVLITAFHAAAGTERRNKQIGDAASGSLPQDR